MSGPALNPIANTPPAASAKGPTGTRPDASAEAAGPDAPEQGFATELQRRMQGEARSDDTTTQAKTTAQNDEAADAAATPPADALASQVPPELAALLAAGNMQTTSEPPALPKPESGTLDASPRDGASAGRAALLAAAAESGNPARATAEATAQPANLAAEADTLAAPSIAKAQPELAVATNGSGAERMAEAAAPTNNFAAIHAAALANLRGEAPPPATAPVSLHVATPAGSTGWPEEVGNRVTWMVGHDESHAELTLTPPQLGKVEISITISGEQTSAQFVAATPAARELIEQSLPRLREILEQSGINLGQTDVGTSSQPGSSGEGRRGSARGSAGGDAEGGMTNTTAAPWLRRAEGLVDTFA
ncbi:flagellar hook-length control protein FliK [Zoogloea sp.]|uniref:flagellar hook-length control protein FliK n=1 Tax=Zoogloea sp. TaxID=49181 RepID=UPI002608B875|nr:flagellar hook-length control protein FliK [Zoogloea sp.]